MFVLELYYKNKEDIQFSQAEGSSGGEKYLNFTETLQFCVTVLFPSSSPLLPFSLIPPPSLLSSPLLSSPPKCC